VAEISLRDRSARFAHEIQTTVRAVLPGLIDITSTAAPGRMDRYVVAPAFAVGRTPGSARIPLLVDGEELAQLGVVIYLGMDAVDKYLKAVRMDLSVLSTLDRTPLVRLEYQADMHTAPIAHWQIHAERGAFSHLLARAHAVRPSVVPKPHNLSSLHLPVGGERFRPCLEDFLQFLVQECGVDALDDWEDAVRAGREQWRRRQARTVARDAQAEVAEALREAGWTVTPPDEDLTESVRILSTW
jgi:hypothetical protein